MKTQSVIVIVEFESALTGEKRGREVINWPTDLPTPGVGDIVRFPGGRLDGGRGTVCSRTWDLDSAEAGFPALTLVCDSWMPA